MLFDRLGRCRGGRRGDRFAPDAVDNAVWDVDGDALLDPLDGFDGTWVGPRQLGGSFSDGAVGVYDLDTRSRSPEIESEPGDGVWYVPEAERTYQWIADVDDPDPRLPGVIKVFDASDDGGRDIGPDIPTLGHVMSVSATSGGRRVVVTAYMPDTETQQRMGGWHFTTVHDGRTGRALGEPMAGPWTTRVSADGTLLGADAGTITQYDLDTLRPIGNFPGESGQLSRIQFSSDGRVALVALNDRSLSVYDVATRSRLGDPIAADSPPDWLGALRPDGKALAVTVADGIQIWDLDPDRLAQATCNLVGRNLTRTEWAIYMADFGAYRPTCPGLD